MGPFIGTGRICPGHRQGCFRLADRGFTLFEVLAVMLVLSILTSIAIPSYKRSQIKAQETVLAEDLYQIRQTIDAFYADYGRYPGQLAELVRSKYLRGIPRDPFTRSSDSWMCVPPEPASDGEIAAGGCFDIRSGSDLVGLNGVPYRQW